VIARLPLAEAAAPSLPGVSHAWVGALALREAERIRSASAPLVAFRYAPDPECFFRGDDPLAIALAVPEVLSLAIMPAQGAWPALEDFEPFACVSVLEGMSSAPAEAVRSAFRLVANQVDLQVIDAGASRTSEATPGEANRVLRVEAARIDALADDLGELLVAANALSAIAHDAAAVDQRIGARIRAAQAEIGGKVRKLHRSISRVRLVPLAPALSRLPRMVRETAETLGKNVRFTMSGETLDVDKQIADALFEPLLHLVRNAIDHGIEDAESRLADGKPAEGALSLAVTREGDTILVILADDGAGMDPARLRKVAVARNVLTTAAAADLSDAAALRLIFAPGFSTAQQLTGISGRGVGMDAVQSAVEKLRGTVEIDSTPGEGSRFLLRLPASALTTRLLVIEVGEERYGVALDQIVETVRVEHDALMPVGDGLACVLRGRTVPVLSLAALLGGEQAGADNAKLLITQSGGEWVALRVDGFAERIDTIVRPPSPMLAALPGVSGSALLGDGGVLLVLDLPELAA
jgi:two-component system chemotaxis sensor kinase CheA